MPHGDSLVLSRSDAPAPDPRLSDSRLELAGILARPGQLEKLADNGRAPEILLVIKTLEPKERAEVLAVKGAISALAMHGQAAAVVDLLKALPPSYRVDPLAAEMSVTMLALNRQGGATIRLIRSLEPEQQFAVLAVDGIQNLHRSAPKAFAAMMNALPAHFRDRFPFAPPPSSSRPSRNHRSGSRRPCEP